MRSTGSAGGAPTPSGSAVREYVESFVTEDGILAAARERGRELGCTPIGPGGGAALRFLASALVARAVVEVGTGAGTSGLWLLRGMAPDGVLTSIDVEPEHQRAARQAFAEAGFPPCRYRLIMGQALDVLPRLTDGGYDLVFVDAAKPDYPRYLETGVRLLRPGGVIAFDNALWSGKVADPALRDPSSTALREVGAMVRDDETLIPLMLPLGDGLLLALRTS
ncbi:MAG TPA: O-methyltransferase [Pseudonocardiaceae bacterium]|nr:O-methyltransferase [Pseudonocardiaceae bacterium]